MRLPTHTEPTTDPSAQNLARFKELDTPEAKAARAAARAAADARPPPTATLPPMTAEALAAAAPAALAAATAAGRTKRVTHEDI